MDKKNLFLFVLFLAFATAMVVAIAQTDVSADEGSRAGGDYIGSDSCQSCHPGNYTGWSQTRHPGAWDKLNNSSQMVDACKRCHATGHNEVAIGGFDPSTDLPVSMQGVQCESCHGPGENHRDSENPDDIVMSYSSYVCGAVCHQEEHHPYYEEWNLSGHAMSLISLKGATGAAEDSCLECHSADYVLAGFKNRTLPTLIQRSMESLVLCAMTLTMQQTRISSECH